MERCCWIDPRWSRKRRESTGFGLSPSYAARINYFLKRSCASATFSWPPLLFPPSAALSTPGPGSPAPVSFPCFEPRVVNKEGKAASRFREDLSYFLAPPFLSNTGPDLPLPVELNPKGKGSGSFTPFPQRAKRKRSVQEKAVVLLGPGTLLSSAPPLPPT